jgi:hypothetical protein
MDVVVVYFEADILSRHLPRSRNPSVSVHRLNHVLPNTKQICYYWIATFFKRGRILYIRRKMSQSLDCARERVEEKKKDAEERGEAQGIGGLFPYVLWHARSSFPPLTSAGCLPTQLSYL